MAASAFLFLAASGCSYGALLGDVSFGWAFSDGADCETAGVYWIEVALLNPANGAVVYDRVFLCPEGSESISSLDPGS
ncbi:MAG: hypothetical protein WC889_08195 [Myxococcota bacterium]